MIASDLMETPANAHAQAHYCLFDTAIGACGIAWSASGLTRLQLPEPNRSATEKRLSARAAKANAAPAEIERLIRLVQSYMMGRCIDFSAAILDLTGITTFEEDVYAAARRIPWGRTRSYGELALKIGARQAARAVGRALARNPVPIIVPCHRILAKGHRVGGFSAPGGIVTKQHLLALEGVHVEAGTPLFPGFD